MADIQQNGCGIYFKRNKMIDDIDELLKLKPVPRDVWQRNNRYFKKKTVETMKKLAEKKKKENGQTGKRKPTK